MSLRGMVKKLGRGINRIIPKNNSKILFESNSDFCDNTRAVYDYLIKNGYGETYRFVWCVNDPKTFHAEGMVNTKLVSFKSKKRFLSYFKEMATSRYILYTHYVPPLCNSKVQTVVNLWHGTPLKTIKGHVHPENLFNYLLSPSTDFDGILADSFEMAGAGKLLHFGYPRNDLLFQHGRAMERLGLDLSSFRKAILWMPTFRRPADGLYEDSDVNPTGLPLIETDRQLEALNRPLAENGVLLIIKLHPGQDMSGIRLQDLSHIKMLTNRELDEKGVQLYHLVGEADVLLTDYSSVYFDYLLLDRPIGFIIDDIDKYQKNRGFVIDDPLTLMPGEKIKTIGELAAFIGEIISDKDSYAEMRHWVCDRANQYQDGESCRRLAEHFFGPPPHKASCFDYIELPAQEADVPEGEAAEEDTL